MNASPVGASISTSLMPPAAPLDNDKKLTERNETGILKDCGNFCAFVNNDGVTLFDFVCRDEERKFEYGRALVKRLMEWGREKGVGSSIRCQPDSNDNLVLLAEMGFVPIDKQVNELQVKVDKDAPVELEKFADGSGEFCESMLLAILQYLKSDSSLYKSQIYAYCDVLEDACIHPKMVSNNEHIIFPELLRILESQPGKEYPNTTVFCDHKQVDFRKGRDSNQYFLCDQAVWKLSREAIALGESFEGFRDFRHLKALMTEAQGRRLDTWVANRNVG